MQEDKKITDDIDDDFLEDEDDFDFDDIDDETGDGGTGDSDIDLGDDSWDEFDDTPDAQEAAAKSPEQKTKKKGAASSADKPSGKAKAKSSGFKKSNLIIIAGAVVLGGGALVVTQMRGSPQNQTSISEAPSDVAASIAPQPDSALPDANIFSEQIADEAVFGGPDDLESQPQALPEEQVSVDIDGAPPMPAPMSAPSAGAETPEPAPAQSSNEVLTPMPDIAALSEEQQLASLNQPLEEEVAPNVAADPSQPPAPPVADLIETPAEALPVEPGQPDAAVAESATLNQEQEARIESMGGEIQTLEGKLAEANDSLARKAEEADKKIAELNDTITKLEERIASLSSSKPEAIQPSPKPKAAEKQPRVPAGTTKWQLRSAQPGKALISESGSSDFKTVVVGDNLRGLGRIVSIDLESGKWVVTGTQGRISQ